MKLNFYLKNIYSLLLKIYLISKKINLYILFFLEKLMGINKNIHIVRNINDTNFKLVNAKSIKNIINIGKPIYKSFISIYFPNVFFRLFIVI